MPDMLVNLLRLPPFESEVAGARVRRAEVYEMSAVRAFIERDFDVAWADEATAGFANKPVSVYVATRARRVVGFAAYECTRRNFFGPAGVEAGERGRGLGRALLVASLWGLRELGYVYAIIGGVGPVEFYRRTVGAFLIPDSAPGIYTDIVRYRKTKSESQSES